MSTRLGQHGQWRSGRQVPWAACVRRCAAVLACGALLAPLPGLADEPVDTITLGEALTKALAEGLDARIARLESERADHAAKTTRAAVLPQVGASSELGWSNRYNETFTAADGAGTVRKYPLGSDHAWLQLTLSQILLDLKQWHELEREQLAAEAARVAEQRKRDDVAYEVTRRYARLVALERKAEFAAEQLAEAQWLEQQASHLHAAGRALDVERDLTRLHRSDAELAERSWDREIAIARADLWLSVGEPEPLRVPIDPDSLPRIDPRDTNSSAADAVPNSPELRILDLQRRMADASVAAAQAGRLPTMKLVSGYSHYGPKRYDSYEDEVFVGVGVELPIFDGLRSTHEIEAARGEAEIARLRYQQALAGRRARVRELAQRLEIGDASLALAREQQAAAREELRLADVNLRAERGDLRGAIAAREIYTQRASAVIDAEFDQIDRWAELRREVGDLTNHVLGPVAAAAAAATP